MCTRGWTRITNEILYKEFWVAPRAHCCVCVFVVGWWEGGSKTSANFEFSSISTHSASVPRHSFLRRWQSTCYAKCACSRSIYVRAFRACQLWRCTHNVVQLAVKPSVRNDFVFEFSLRLDDNSRCGWCCHHGRRPSNTQEWAFVNFSFQIVSENRKWTEKYHVISTKISNDRMNNALE